MEAMGLLQRTRERISQAEEAWDDLEHPDAQSLKDLQALQKQAVVRKHSCARAHRNPVRVHDEALMGSHVLTMRDLQTPSGILMQNAWRQCCMALLLSWSWGRAAVVESMLRSTSFILLPMKSVS